MRQVIAARFEDGVLKPDGCLDLKPGTRVTVTVVSMESEPDRGDAACQALDDLCESAAVDSGGRRLSRDQLHERG